MLFSKDEKLEDAIVRQAISSKISVKALHDSLAKTEPITLNAVYKAVDKLIAAGVLLKVGKSVLVDEEWTRKVSQILSSSSSVTLPLSGEKLQFEFSSIVHLDAFWKTLVLPIHEAGPKREVFFYNPHNFWAYLPDRKDSEDQYYSEFREKGLQGFFTVGGNTLADSEFKKGYQSPYFQVDTRAMTILPRTDHITVIGPLIITVRLPKKAALEIDALYEAGQGINEILLKVLNILSSVEKIRFIVENNGQKAQKIVKQLSKNFYFSL